MTYKTALDKFEIKYRLASLVHGRTKINLTNEEVFMLITGAYAHLANKHKLIQKYSTDNTIIQTNLVAGQYEYKSGGGATNIPNDLGDIYNVTLGDGTPLTRLGISSIETPPNGIPTGYAIDKTNKILKLNATPTESYASNSAMRLVIFYTAKVEPFTGTATGSYANLDFNESDFGDSFLTDDLWSDLIINWAIAELIPEKKQEVLMQESELVKARPTFYNYEIPYYNGTYEDFTDNETLGQDGDRG